MWLLLVLGLFYWVIQPQGGPIGEPEPVKVPVLDLSLPSATVLASAPAVLFLLTLVVFGALSAYRVAEARLKPDWDDETIDEHPNVIDWVAYTARRSPIWLRRVVGFSYPLYMSIFAYEAWYFLVPLPFEPEPVPGRWVMVAIGVVEAMATFYLLCRFWIARYRQLFPQQQRAA